MSPLVRGKNVIPFHDKEGVCWKCGSSETERFADEQEAESIIHYYTCMDCDTEGFEYYEIKFKGNSPT